MKKFLVILTTVLGIGLLTGCGNTEAKVDETTYTETVANEAMDETYEVCTFIYTEEYVEELKNETIAEIEECYEEEGISEDCKNEIIELIKSVKYDPSFEYGYDLDSLQINYVNILVNYDVLPEVCRGLTFDEIDAIEM